MSGAWDGKGGASILTEGEPSKRTGSRSRRSVPPAPGTERRPGCGPDALSQRALWDSPEVRKEEGSREQVPGAGFPHCQVRPCA